MRAVAPSPVLQVIPIVDFPARLVFGVAVSFLNFAFQLVLFSVDHIKIIVRKLAPLLFDLALHLLSVSFHAIPIHDDLLYDDTTNARQSFELPQGHCSARWRIWTWGDGASRIPAAISTNQRRPNSGVLSVSDTCAQN